MSTKLGIYFCTCGGSLVEKIDAAALRRLVDASGEGNCFRQHDLLCSEEGKQFLEDDLRENGIERAVICACSPREHEPTFMRCMARAGRNPYLMQMVNVREQVAWVCETPVEATDKATRALAGALARIGKHQPLEKSEIDICVDALVIGGGPAGMRAALTIAEAGRKVVLVEKSPVLGGMPVRYEDVYPKLECAPCMLEPMMADLMHGEHAHRIEILTMAEVVQAVGSYGNFTLRIRQHPRHVDAEKCIGCGECISPCPGSADSPFDVGLGRKKAMAFPFAGALPNLPYLDEAACVRFGQGASSNPSCDVCQRVCPVEGAVILDEQPRTIERTVGAVVMAVGARLYDCSVFANLGFGTLADVYTNLQFERLLASNGPTGGELRTRDGRRPNSIAIVHCVGSLDDEHKSYCSGICCQVAFKFNHLIGKRVPGARVIHYFKELVTAGKSDAGLRSEAERHGTMIRYGSIRELDVVDEGGLVIRQRGGKTHAVDMVVLCPALVGPEDGDSLCDVFETTVDGHGFFDELHGRLSSAESKVKGVFLAGTCQGPGDIQKASDQGAAAAGYVLSGLVPGRKLEISPIHAVVIQERCSGCRVCGGVCPYKAISFDSDTKTSQTNEVLCQGCGTCVAACPSGAIDGKHFTNEAIFAEIGGLLK